jgi:glutaredoxin
MKEVVVYSANWCAGCNVVKRMLSVKGIAYTEVDIDTEEGMFKAKELGIRNIPVTFVNGEKFVGSTPQTIDVILKEIE